VVGLVSADDARREAAGGGGGWSAASWSVDNLMQPADSRAWLPGQQLSAWLNIRRSSEHSRICREGRGSDMDSAMARANRSGDDSEIADGLTRREHDILAFERQWWKYAGAKEEAIKELFAMSATRYYQVLNALVDRPEALAADPMLVKRLRRLRASRQKARAARRLGFEIT
jgi:hypothetical protein